MSAKVRIIFVFFELCSLWSTNSLPDWLDLCVLLNHVRIFPKSPLLGGPGQIIRYFDLGKQPTIVRHDFYCYPTVIRTVDYPLFTVQLHLQIPGYPRLISRTVQNVSWMIIDSPIYEWHLMGLKRFHVLNDAFLRSGAISDT